MFWCGDIIKVLIWSEIRVQIWGRCKAGLSLCESCLPLNWIIFVQKVGMNDMNGDRTVSLRYAMAPYCESEKILCLWQLCVNVLCRVFLNFMPGACSVYHCLLSDWGYCTVPLNLVQLFSSWWRAKPSRLVVRALHCWLWEPLEIKIIQTLGPSKCHCTVSSGAANRKMKVGGSCTSKRKQGSPLIPDGACLFVCVVGVWDMLYFMNVL